MARERASDKAPSDKPPFEARRKGHGFRQAAGSARKVVSKVASTRGFSEPDVLIRWDEIAGPALADACRPVKVSYGRRGGLGATLLVEADGARALEIEHLAPRIVERVNAHYGYRAISRLKVTQAAGMRGMAEGGTGFDLSGAPGERWRGEAREPAPVLPEAAREAETLTSGIRNPELRAALAEMSAHVLSRTSPTCPPETTSRSVTPESAAHARPTTPTRRT